MADAAIYAPIPGISPVAPALSIIGAADPLPSTDYYGRPLDWRSGIRWREAGCVQSHPWPGICPSAAVVDEGKADAPAITQPQFRPYGIYTPFACDWDLPSQHAEMRAMAQTQLEAVTAWAVSREVWTGVADSMDADGGQNPTLMSDATDLTVHDAIEPDAAVATLLSAYFECAQSGGPVLHLPTILIPSLMRRAMLSQVGDQLRGPLGSRVSPGPGYPGPGPWGPGGAVAPAGEVWAYITGPVEYALGDARVLPIEEESQFDRRENRYELWAERQAIHRFDPCCVFAVLVDVPDIAPEAS